MADQPTQAQMEDMNAVAAAGGEAAAKGATPEEGAANARQAMQAERDKRNIDWLSDEDLDKLAAMLTGKLVNALDERGAFEPTEPVQAAEPPSAPPAPGEQPAAAAVEAPPQPRKQNFAERFMGS